MGEGMSKRFGRNQRRKMREEVRAARSDAYQAQWMVEQEKYANIQISKRNRILEKFVKDVELYIGAKHYLLPDAKRVKVERLMRQLPVGYWGKTELDPATLTNPMMEEATSILLNAIKVTVSEDLLRAAITAEVAFFQATGGREIFTCAQSITQEQIMNAGPWRDELMREVASNLIGHFAKGAERAA
jgi:hypothetical protein